MRTSFRTSTVVIGAVMGVLALSGTPARADLELKVGTTLITDNGVGDSDTGMGSISFNQSGISITVSKAAGNGQSTSPFGGLFFSVNPLTASAYPADLTFMISDDTFTLPVGSAELTAKLSTLTSSGGPSGNVSLTGYYSGTDTLFDTTGVSTGTITAAVNGAVQSATSAATIFTSPFSLTEVIMVHLTAPGTSQNPSNANSVQFQANLDAASVPEPASIALLGGLLLLTGFGLRRKYQPSK